MNPMRDIKLYPIEKIVKDAGFGGSCPIIVEANSTQYILKTKEDGMQPASLGIFNELLAYQLLSVLGYSIAPQELAYLWIDDDFIEAAEIAFHAGSIKEESYENIRDSKGVNIGIEYLHYAMDTLDRPIDNKSFIKDILHIDNYIMNCDRTTDNPNVLQDTRNKRQFYAIDFGNALADGNAYKKIVAGSMNIFELGKITQCNATLSGRYLFRNPANPLVKNPRRVKGDIVKIRRIVDDILATFPPQKEWEPMQYKEQIADIIVARLKNRTIFDASNSSKCDCLY